MLKYRERMFEKSLELELEAFGAVLIEGPKWCGKTTTAKQYAKSLVEMQDSERKIEYLQMAKLTPSTLLKGENPRLIDEWQMAPMLWDAIRYEVDKRNEEGLFIITGSTSVDEQEIDHSGAGRISRIRMRTMSLFELGESNGTISISDIFDGKTDLTSRSSLEIVDIAKLIVRGGWPRTIGKNQKVAVRQVSGYCETIINSDISTVDGTKRDKEKTEAIMQSYGRSISTQTANTTILNDINTNNKAMHINTLEDYLSALRKLFVIEDLKAWSPHLRSKTAIRTSNTRHFTDPAIAAHFLGASAEDLLKDIRTFGLLFESLVVRDLRVYAECLDGKVYHYRDRSGLEADAIIHLNDGRWGAIEVKLGARDVEEAAKNLLKLAKKIDTDKMKASTFLMVVTGTEYGYVREDGVIVVPVGCLTA
ncbi:MAG: ATP-binding protein [Anaerovoracaceae bacterium]